MTMRSWMVLAGLLVLAPTCKKEEGVADAAEVTGSRVEIEVNAEGYKPENVKIPAGKAMTLVFKRITDEGCGQEVMVPALGIKKDLPLNTPVEIALPAQEAGQKVLFTCGMKMMKGSIIVAAAK